MDKKKYILYGLCPDEKREYMCWMSAATADKPEKLIKLFYMKRFPFDKGVIIDKTTGEIVKAIVSNR